MVDEFDVVIIGGGAAGSEAAFAIAGLDGWRGEIGPGRAHRVLLVESRHFGGTCTNEGCVPTKALVRAARILHLARAAGKFGLQIADPGFDWGAVRARMNSVRDQMLRHGAGPFEEQGIEVMFPARARLAGPGSVLVDGREVKARSVVVAAGLGPAVPPIPGLPEAGFVDNEGALAMTTLPRRLGVLGGGAIGCEFAQIIARFGVQVTVVEALDRLLPPEEPEGGAALREAFAEEGISVRLASKVTSVSKSGGGKLLSFGSGPALEVDEILVAVGRRLDGESLGLDAAGIRWSPQGVEVDGALKTSQPWAFAAGDVTGGPLFSHVASEMGRVAGINAALGTSEEVDMRVVPRVTFTDPEVASVGLTEAAARESGRPVRVGFAPLAEAEKAQIDGISTGHVKVVSDAASGEILGCQVVAEEAGSMVHEAVAAMAAGTPVAVLARAMHAYPTLSELMRSAFAEAAG